MNSIKIILFLILLCFYMCTLYGVTGWEKPVLISLNKYQNQYPDVIQYNNITAVTWVAYKKNTPYIYFNYKDTKWHTPVTVTKLKKNKLLLPSINISGDNIYIFFSDNNNQIQIYYKALNKREAFRPLTIITNEPFCILPNTYNFNDRLFLFYQKYIDNKQFEIKYFSDIQNHLFPMKANHFINITGKKYGSFFPVIKYYNNNVYAMWINRKGSENTRNDIISFNSSENDFGSWSEEQILSDMNEDAKFPDFIIINNNLYLVYHVTEYDNFQYNSYVITKIIDLSQGKTVYKKKIPMNYSALYKLKLGYKNNKFYILWYSYIKKNAQILITESDDFKNWNTPIQITKRYNNKLVHLQTDKNLSIIYENHQKKRTLIYYQEKDITCASPKIYSKTHRSNQWSYNNSPIIKWKDRYDISGIKGYAYILDEKSDTVPEIENLAGTFNGKSFENLNNGIYYFHLRSIDKADNFSEPVHYKLMINNRPPDAPTIYSDTHREFIPTDDNSPVFNWEQKDNRSIKGYSYLLTQDENLEPNNKINTRKKTVKFKNLNEGIWYFKIKACDPFKRWSDSSTYTITIEKILIATKVQQDAESRYSYIVKPGDVLSIIISKILKTKRRLEWRNYEKPVGKFNYIQNLDFLKPGDIIMFPILIAKPNDTIEKISRDIFGTEGKKENIIVIGKEKNNQISPGDKVIIKDKYFLKTGKMKK